MPANVTLTVFFCQFLSTMSCYLYAANLNQQTILEETMPELIVAGGLLFCSTLVFPVHLRLSTKDKLLLKMI